MALLFPLCAITGGAVLSILWGALPEELGWSTVVVVGGLTLVHRVGARINEKARSRTAAVAGDGQGGLPAGEPTPLLQTLSNLGVALIVTDAGGTVLHASAAACEVLQCEGRPPRAALDLSGTFFGLTIDDAQALATLHRFFGSKDENADGLVTCLGGRREVYWTGRLLGAEQGLNAGRLFMIRDVTAERHLEAMKTDFLGTVSHELRTPLTSLRGSLELILARSSTLAEGDRDLLAIGVKNTERLIQLTNDLLDVDRLERGTMSFQFATVDVPELVTAALKATTGACETRGLKVTVDIAEDIPPVHADAERLLQVLVNILDNTTRYSPPGAPVVVRVRSRDAGVQIDICDRGPGIPGAEQAHVFERFWRADRADGDAGTGLGLAICRAIVHGHGGHIWLDSEEGQGTTFSVLLPRSLFKAQPEDTAAASYGPANPVILLIEDDADTRAITRASLELHDFVVLEAATAVQGVNVARREHPHVILLDLGLPDLAGFDVLRVLKNDPDAQSIPIVVLSVTPQIEVAQELGAADVLQKPARFEAIRWTLARALRRAHQPEGRLVVGMGPAVSKDLMLLARELEGETHEIYRGRDLQDLVAWSSNHYPDLLVLDEDILPESRAEAAELLRHPVTGAPVPLVFLSGGPGNGNGDSEIWTGLGKPISKDDFMAAAQRLVVPASQR